MAVIKIVKRLNWLACDAASPSNFLSRCDTAAHWACVDLRRAPGFGDPRRDRLCLGLTKFSQGQLGAAAEARGLDSFDMAMAG